MSKNDPQISQIGANGAGRLKAKNLRNLRNLWITSYFRYCLKTASVEFSRKSKRQTKGEMQLVNWVG